MSFRCPCCGAEERLGVWFPPLKVKILDAVKRSGTAGLHYASLDMKRETLKAHVFQINSYLQETDWRIRATRGNVSGYYLVKVRA